MAMEVAPSPRHPPRKGGPRSSSSARRRSEMVDTEGIWCCIVKKSPPVAREDDWRRRAEENAGEPKELLLRSKELEALIKQGSGIVAAKSSPFRLRLSPGRVSPISENAIVPVKSPSGKFLTSPSPPAEKTKSSPTLLEMMNLEQDMGKQTVLLSLPRPPSVQEKVDAILLLRSPGNQFNDPRSSDVRLTLTGRDGFSVSISVHRHILTSQSRFFAAKFSDWWSKQHRSPLNAVEISECEDVDLYLQTIRLMYCKDLKRSLMKENVARVLGILKVSAAILFEAGVVSCLEYLEAVPWAEDEEEKITALVSQLQLDGIAAMEVLKRLSIMDSVEPEPVVARLLQSVISGTSDEKARREAKTLVSRLLRDSNATSSPGEASSLKACFYRACDSCVEQLVSLFTQMLHSSTTTTSTPGLEKQQSALPVQISRQADNLNWLLEILVDRQLADGFVKQWAGQGELAGLYSRLPSVYRYEVSRVTAGVVVAIGRGQVLVGQEVRLALLTTWFQLLVDDFGWLQRCCKGMDKKAVEEGLSQTILTLPLRQQQAILLAWFECFSRSCGSDCPNLNRAFEVWWRRTFVKPLVDVSALPQIASA